MIGFYISLPFLIFALYRLFIVFYNFFSRPFLPNGNPSESPAISIIVDANTDSEKVKKTITELTNQTYTNIEILVGVNNTSQATHINTLREILAKDKRIRIIETGTVPEGWLEDNYIADTLIQQSNGQYIVKIAHGLSFDNNIIANSLSYIQLNGLSLLTLFTTQYPEFQKNRTHIQIRNWLLITLVSLKKIRTTKSESSSYTSNQFAIFSQSIYKNLRWFEKYKSSNDIELAIGRIVKKSGQKIASLLAASELIEQGSEKDKQDITSIIFNFFGRNNKRIYLFAFVSTFGLLIAILLLPFPLVLLYLFSVLSCRMLYAAIIGRSTIMALITLPIHHFIFLYYVYRIYRNSKNSK